MGKNGKGMVRTTRFARWFGAGSILFLLGYLVVEYLRFPSSSIRIDKQDSY